MAHPITHNEAGDAVWWHQPGDQYVVTGTDAGGRRFRAMIYNDWWTASGINLYRGSKWLLRDGKRYLIVRIYN